MKVFVPGTIVRLVKNEHMNAEIGAEATVEGVKETCVNVKWHRETACNSQCDGPYDAENFEELAVANTWQTRYELLERKYLSAAKRADELQWQLGRVRRVIEKVKDLTKLLKEEEK
jgi:hypothetical protein